MQEAILIYPIKENLRAEMERTGLNGVRLSALSGVSSPRISSLLHGHVTNPQIETLGRLAEGLQITVDALIKVRAV